MSHHDHPCHCGAPDCLVGEIGAAMQKFEDAGGDISRSRLLWCTYPGCRSFEVVDDLAHRLTYLSARCPEHQEADQ